MQQEPPQRKEGMIVADRYRLTQRLGDGNFGEVWKATDVRLESPDFKLTPSFAIKFLKDEYVYDPEVRAEFRGEIATLYQLTHHNLLRIFDHNLLPDMAYVVTEFADGGSLAQHLARNNGPFTLEEAGNYLKQVSAGLDAAHVMGFVHRDLKPHNLFLVGSRLVVADFGLVKILSISATRSILQERPAGTPPYMAPEQWDWQVSKYGDIYALGIILYQMITGRLPYRASSPNPREWQELHKNAPIPSVQENNPSLPRELDVVFEAALAKDPKSRPATAGRLSELYLEAIESLANARGRGLLYRKAAPDELKADAPTKPLEVEDSPPQPPQKHAKGWPPVDPDVSIMTRRPVVPAPASLGGLGKKEPSIIKKLGAIRQQKVQRNSAFYRFIPLGTHLKTLEGHSNYINSLAFSADGAWLVSASLDKTVRVWELETGQVSKVLAGHTGSVNSVAISRDGKVIASGSTDKTVRLWDVATGNLLKTLENHHAIVFAVAFSPDGTLLATASADKTIKLWDVRTWEVVHTLEGHQHHVMSIAFSPESDGLASASKDRTVRVWDVQSGQEVAMLEGHDDAVSSVSFSTDGKRIASGSHDKSVKLWSLETQIDYKTFRNNGGEWVHAVAFSHDGRTLVSASSIVKLRDMINGTELYTLEGHSDLVNAAAFSPDDRYLATGADDKLIKIWSAERLDAGH